MSGNKMKKTTLAILISSISFGAMSAQHPHEHFGDVGSQGGKPASKSTIQYNNEFSKTLNYKDVRAFENNNRGLIAEFDQETGDIIHNSFNFIDPDAAHADQAPDSVNPSL